MLFSLTYTLALLGLLLCIADASHDNVEEVKVLTIVYRIKSFYNRLPSLIIIVFSDTVILHVSVELKHPLFPFHRQR